MVVLAPLLLFLVLAAFALWYVYTDSKRDRR
jgi:Flp pilus assembly protein TadG